VVHPYCNTVACLLPTGLVSIHLKSSESEMSSAIWTAEEDARLLALVDHHGLDWHTLALHMETYRSEAACRKRYGRMKSRGRVPTTLQGKQHFREREAQQQESNTDVAPMDTDKDDDDDDDGNDDGDSFTRSVLPTRTRSGKPISCLAPQAEVLATIDLAAQLHIIDDDFEPPAGILEGHTNETRLAAEAALLEEIQAGKSLFWRAKDGTSFVIDENQTYYQTTCDVCSRVIESSETWIRCLTCGDFDICATCCPDVHCSTHTPGHVLHAQRILPPPAAAVDDEQGSLGGQPRRSWAPAEDLLLLDAVTREGLDWAQVGLFVGAPACECSRRFHSLMAADVPSDIVSPGSISARTGGHKWPRHNTPMPGEFRSPLFLEVQARPVERLTQADFKYLADVDLLDIGIITKDHVSAAAHCHSSGSPYVPDTSTLEHDEIDEDHPAAQRRLSTPTPVAAATNDEEDKLIATVNQMCYSMRHIASAFRRDSVHQ